MIKSALPLSGPKFDMGRGIMGFLGGSEYILAFPCSGLV